MKQTASEIEAAIEAQPERVGLYFQLFERLFRALDWRGVSKTIDVLEDAHPDVWEAMYQKGLRIVAGTGVVLLIVSLLGARAVLVGARAVLDRRA